MSVGRGSSKYTVIHLNVLHTLLSPVVNGDCDVSALTFIEINKHSGLTIIK